MKTSVLVSLLLLLLLQGKSGLTHAFILNNHGSFKTQTATAAPNSGSGNANTSSLPARAVDLLADILREMRQSAACAASSSSSSTSSAAAPPAPASSEPAGDLVTAGVQASSCTARFLSRLGPDAAAPGSSPGMAAANHSSSCTGNLDSDRLGDRGLCPWFYRVNEVKDGTRIPRVLMEAQCNCSLSSRCRQAGSRLLVTSCQAVTARVPVTRCAPQGDACWSDLETLAVGCACVYNPIHPV